MDLTGYRERDSEQERIGHLLALASARAQRALDIGARDGYISTRLADRAESVTALDLVEPSLDHPRIACVQGDVTALQFPDESFDLVVCAEVLEHIPSPLLPRACAELERVAARDLLISVPYKQDLRVARCTCVSCGKKNPPWGHVNRFDERRLSSLFPQCRLTATRYSGVNRSTNNWLATALMDFAGNPYGTYDQEEPCIHCKEPLRPPSGRNIVQKIATRLAFYTRRAQRPFSRPHPNWIQLRLRKMPAPGRRFDPLAERRLAPIEV